MHPLLDPRLSKYIVVCPTGCWIWGGARISTGYGETFNGKRPVLAHRVTYEAVKGPISDGLTIDHLCRVRACCNPDHLEAVSMRVNCLRGIGPSAKAAVKTHCVHGHALEDAYRYMLGDDNWPRRVCRTCHRLRMRSRVRRTINGKRVVVAIKNVQSPLPLLQYRSRPRRARR